MSSRSKPYTMPMKGSGSTELQEIDRRDDGVGWIAHPDERMQRASHALVDDGDETDGNGVWLIDPVDAADLEELLSGFGDVLGVVVLLDRHKRDAAEIARRHDVSVYRPTWMQSIDEAIEAPVRALDTELGGTGYRVRKRLDLPVWKEAVLYRPDDGSLLVPESFGTVDIFCAPGERLGVHPMLRLTPPGDLGGLAVERVLVGHGSGITDGAQQAIRDAIGSSRSRAPSLYLSALRASLG